MRIRVLHVYPQLNCGGTEMVIYNLIKFGNHDKFQYELLVQRSGNNEDVFRALNCKIHTVDFTNKKQYYNSLIDFFRKEKFDVVHAHMHTDMPLVLKAAKNIGIKCRASHSHNARVDIPRIFWPLLYFAHHKYEKYASSLFGCSNIALKWLFPLRWKSGKVINNGIDLSKFRFNAVARDKFRYSNQISSNTKVFINVGRCTNQKNQKFILQLAYERLDKDELYVIIGEGPLFDDLKKQKADLGLTNVLLLGQRNDVNNWLSASDVFLFPSIYEGLGIVAIEAQACGLRVIASDTIPLEADMQLGNFNSANLSDLQKWHDLMDLPIYDLSERTRISSSSVNSDYNIGKVTYQVESTYIK